jgi:hypothetical protein
MKAEIISETMPDGEDVIRKAYGGHKLRQETDGLGRELPCIEYIFRRAGFT